MSTCFQATFFRICGGTSQKYGVPISQNDQLLLRVALKDSKQKYQFGSYLSNIRQCLTIILTFAYQRLNPNFPDDIVEYTVVLF